MSTSADSFDETMRQPVVNRARTDFTWYGRVEISDDSVTVDLLVSGPGFIFEFIKTKDADDLRLRNYLSAGARIEEKDGGFSLHAGGRIVRLDRFGKIRPQAGRDISGQRSPEEITKRAERTASGGHKMVHVSRTSSLEEEKRSNNRHRSVGVANSSVHSVRV